MAKTWALFLFWILWSASGWTGECQRPAILPLKVPTSQLWELGVHPGDDLWLEVVFRASPDGVILHTEIAEKIWWIQEIPYLFLGSTGLPLPRDLMKRATAYVDLSGNQIDLSVQSILIRPQTEGIVLGDSEREICAALGDEMPTVDATYLSQVANYMANHLTMLQVIGSSYWVDGVGMVIDQTGRWLGKPLFHFEGNMVSITSGSYVQGSISDACRSSDEAPFLHILERDTGSGKPVSPFPVERDDGCVENSRNGPGPAGGGDPAGETGDLSKSLLRIPPESRKRIRTERISKWRVYPTKG